MNRALTQDEFRLLQCSARFQRFVQATIAGSDLHVSFQRRWLMLVTARRGGIGLDRRFIVSQVIQDCPPCEVDIAQDLLLFLRQGTNVVRLFVQKTHNLIILRQRRSQFLFDLPLEGRQPVGKAGIGRKRDFDCMRL